MIEKPKGYVVYIDGGSQGRATAFVDNNALDREDAIRYAAKACHYFGELRAWAFEVYEPSGHRITIEKKVTVE